MLALIYGSSIYARILRTCNPALRRCPSNSCRSGTVCCVGIVQQGLQFPLVWHVESNRAMAAAWEQLAQGLQISPAWRCESISSCNFCCVGTTEAKFANLSRLAQQRMVNVWNLAISIASEQLKQGLQISLVWHSESIKSCRFCRVGTAGQGLQLSLVWRGSFRKPLGGLQVVNFMCFQRQTEKQVEISNFKLKNRSKRIPDDYSKDFQFQIEYQLGSRRLLEDYC